jgi:hypothetical protein
MNGLRVNAAAGRTGLVMDLRKDGKMSPNERLAAILEIGPEGINLGTCPESYEDLKALGVAIGRRLGMPPVNYLQAALAIAAGIRSGALEKVGGDWTGNLCDTEVVAALADNLVNRGVLSHSTWKQAAIHGSRPPQKRR